MRILNLNGLYFADIFRKFGHDVLTMGATDGCDILLERPLPLVEFWNILQSRRFFPDLIFWADTCQAPSVIGFETLPSLTVGFSIDQYCNPWHVPFGHGFDGMLIAQQDYVPLFEQARANRPAPGVAWFPLFCNPTQDRDLRQERDLPMSFVGTLHGGMNPERAPFLNAVKTKAPLVLLQGEYAPVFNRSRLVLNQSAAGELNFRLFQAMACGAAVLTEETSNGLHELFTPGEDVLTYSRNNPDHAAAVAAEALREEGREKLAEIAARGRRKVLAQHTATARAKTILQHAERLLAEGRPQWRLQNQDFVRLEMAKAMGILAVDEKLPLPPEHRAFYSDLGVRLSSAAPTSAP